MQRTMKLALFVALGMLGTACAQPQQEAVDPNDIREQQDAYNAAFGAADADAVMAFYADAAIRIDSDGSVMNGIAAIREEISMFFGDNDYVLDGNTEADIQASGDLAVTLSVFREHWTPKAGGETSQQEGQWLVVWQRQADAQWLIIREMWAIVEPEEAEPAA